MLLFGSSYLNQTTTYAQVSQHASLQTFYVTEGNGEAGDGSQGNPFKGLLATLKVLPAQQKVKLVLQNHLVVTANELQLNKNVEIDGQGMSITVKSSKVVVSEPTTLKKGNFKMVKDGLVEPEIIVRDTLLLMDDVSTLVSDGQQTERPTIVIERTKPLETPTAFVVKGNNAELNGVSEIVLADNATVRMSTDTASL